MVMLNDDAAIDRVATGMIGRTLPKGEWTHEAHFATALWLLRNRPELAEPDAIRALISGYNESVGGQNTDDAGYHHSITIASIRAAADHLRAHADAPLHVALAALMAGPLGHPDWLLSYWRRETLFSVPARRGWIEPDLAPLPF